VGSAQPSAGGGIAASAEPLRGHCCSKDVPARTLECRHPANRGPSSPSLSGETSAANRQLPGTCRHRGAQGDSRSAQLLSFRRRTRTPKRELWGHAALARGSGRLCKQLCSVEERAPPARCSETDTHRYQLRSHLGTRLAAELGSEISF